MILGVDPAWAVPAQTALLIVLAVVQYLTHRKAINRTDRVHKEVVDVKRATGVSRRVTDLTAIPVPEDPPTDTSGTPTVPVRRWSDPSGLVFDGERQERKADDQ